MPKKKKLDKNSVINPSDVMEFSYDDYKDLIEAYKQAQEDKKEVFKFKDRDIVVAYAKYLIEHLSHYFGYQYEK